MHYLIFIVGLMISLGGDVRDGMSARFKSIGFMPYHLSIWSTRDIPNLILAFILIAGYASYILALILILSRIFHTLIYDYVRNNWHRFDSNPRPPEWYKNLRKLWSWSQI